MVLVLIYFAYIYCDLSQLWGSLAGIGHNAWDLHLEAREKFHERFTTDMLVAGVISCCFAAAARALRLCLPLRVKHPTFITSLALRLAYSPIEGDR